MALKRHRNTKALGPAAGPETALARAKRAEKAILTLARIIGRQMAREQFDRHIALERKVRRKRSPGEEA
ncbi:hypothetical protein [Ancylobacter polymorphus]|uniref:DUF4169 domain-containing protein n=1 Tax=Ancylobacter polymorphus TaxID=223390 RepID=A0ABU0BF78_9HYPH|nr:hypothetical protein [Ancylobacter polymorphus]MDQ0304490.1 hypothetical protein [Ancylobacter polymorphus]